MPGLSRFFNPFRRDHDLRLAVLPFTTSAAPREGARGGGARGEETPRAETPGEGTFGAGLAGELIALLTRIPALHVIGPLSARDLAQRTREPGDAHRELEADLVLVGHATRSDEELTIEVRLLAAPEGAERWSARWALRPDEVFVILGELAAGVAAALGASTAASAATLVHREPTSDPRAFELYAKGRVLLATPDAARLRAAVMAFETALEHDELFAGATAAIAEAYRTAHELHLPLDREAPLAAIRRIAEEALALDEGLPGAHVSRAYADLHAWELSASEARLRRALQIAPGHAQAHRDLARVLLYRGDVSGAMAAGDTALALEPLSAAVVNESGIPHAIAGRPEQAMERSRRVVRRDPENAMAYFHLGRYAEQLGRHGEAVTYYRAAAELSSRVPYLTAFLGMALASLGDRQEAEDIAGDLERKARRGSAVATCLGVLLLRLHRVDEGVSWLTSALETQEMQLLMLDTPWLPLRESAGDPRVRALLERVRAVVRIDARP